jgi:hypothetical protein
VLASYMISYLDMPNKFAAVQLYDRLLLMTSDPSVHLRLGNLWESMGEHLNAIHHYLYAPADLASLLLCMGRDNVLAMIGKDDTWIRATPRWQVGWFEHVPST